MPRLAHTSATPRRFLSRPEPSPAVRRVGHGDTAVECFNCVKCRLCDSCEVTSYIHHGKLATMQAETDDHSTAQHEPDHIPLGSCDLPLLVHEDGPLKFARQHHRHVPDHDEPGYDHYCALRDVTLSNAIKSFETALRAGTPLAHIDIENGMLTVYYHSQSKLSQQELADLQKATHFDKKELQQWYKGRAP